MDGSFAASHCVHLSGPGASDGAGFARIPSLINQARIISEAVYQPHLVIDFPYTHELVGEHCREIILQATVNVCSATEESRVRGRRGTNVSLIL